MNKRVGSEFLKGSKSKEREFVSRESSEYEDFALKNEFQNMGIAESFAFSLHANELKIRSLQRGVDMYEEALSGELHEEVRGRIQEMFDAEYQKLQDAQTERSELLIAVQDQLIEVMGDEYLEKELVSRVGEIMDSGSSEGKVLQEKFGSAEEAVDMVVFGSDIEDLVLFLNGEAKRFKEKREVAFEQFREWVNDFFERAQDPECQKYLKRSPDEVLSILRKVNFSALDNLKKQTYLGHADGTHIALDLRKIDRDFEGAKHIVFHELAHHLSGLGMAFEDVSVEEGDVPVKKVRRKKMGTSFDKSSGHISTHKNNWLNEALTELVSSKMSGVPFVRLRSDGVTVRSGYENYIDEVWEMVDAGISWDELFDAWSEDMLVEPENGTRIPKYDHLIRRVREVEGRGAMKRHVENIKNKSGGIRVNEETGERYRVNPKKLRLDGLP
jgi:hypothetical protein